MLWVTTWAVGDNSVLAGRKGDFDTGWRSGKVRE